MKRLLLFAATLIVTAAGWSMAVAQIDEPETLVATPTLSAPIGLGSVVEFNIQAGGFTPDSIVFLHSCTAPEGEAQAVNILTDCDLGLREALTTDSNGAYQGTHTFEITASEFALVMADEPEIEWVAVLIQTATQRFAVEPTVVATAGTYELTLTGVGWTPETVLIITPCAAPDGDPRAIDSQVDCRDDAAITTETDAQGWFRAVVTFDVGENFAVRVSNETSTETFAVLAPVVEAAFCDGREATLQGTDGNDELVGTDGPDIIAGLGGDDHIVGMGGDDLICSGGGSDRVFAGAGDDTIFGEGGIDKIRGGSGNDLLDGGNKMDFLKGGDDDDKLLGGNGPDRLRSGHGDDYADGGDSSDRIWGGPGNDTLVGGRGADLVNGGAGRKDQCRIELGVDRYAKCELILDP